MALEPQDIKRIEEMIKKAIDLAVAFPTRKRGDTPTDDLQLTPRIYVNMNGARSERPSVVVAGQHYWSNQDLYPWWTDGVSSWFSATGSVVSKI